MPYEEFKKNIILKINFNLRNLKMMMNILFFKFQKYINSLRLFYYFYFKKNLYGNHKKMSNNNN